MKGLPLALAIACAQRPGVFAALDLGLPARQRPAAGAIKTLEAQPRDALLELRKLYERYSETVQKRIDEGWWTGLLSGAIVEHPDEPVLPARQIEEALKRREIELAALAAKSPQDELKIGEKKREIKSLKKQYNRSKGTCVDWSDAVWADLLKMKPENWSVRDVARRASPYHTAAVLCAPPEDAALCLAFDPWTRGQPDVYEYNSWNDGSFEGRIAAEYFLHHLPEP